MTGRVASTRSASRYVGLAAGGSFLLVVLALTGLFSLLEFVEQLASVGEGRYRVIDAFVFVVLTAPSRLLQVTPVSMLLGCLLSLGALARNSELTAMLSLGLSERRIIGSVLWLALPIAAVLFLLMEFVIPPAQQLAREQRAAALTSHLDASYWARRDRQYLNVQRFERHQVPVGIDIYDFRPDGSLARILHAARAAIRADDSWLLLDVSRKQIGSATVTTDHLTSLPWASFVSPRQIELLILPPDSIPPIALYRVVRHLPRSRQASLYRQELWTKACLPLELVAMIVVAAPFVFGAPRGHRSGQYLARGIGVGICFSLGRQILDRLGLLLDASPALTAVAPSLLVIVLALALFRRTHRGLSTAR